MVECIKGFDDILPMTVVDYKARREYIIEELIGEGGFGRCYKLIRTDNNKCYAGKIILKEYPYTGNQRRQVHHEARIHYHLNHSNIVRMYSYISDNSFYYLVLGFCGKNTLRMYQKEKVTCSIPETKYFVKEIAQGISYLHSKKIVHRDIKLNNIFLTDNMDVKIGDFGLAVVLSYPGEMIKHLCGTPNYISPEVLNGKGYSYGVDVWGLGCILYTLLVGKLPFNGRCKDRIYYKIMNSKITFPTTLDIHSMSMIKRLLTYDSRIRPRIEEVLKSDYLNRGLTGKDVLFPSICKKSPSYTTHQNKESNFRLLPPCGYENVPKNMSDLGVKEDLRYIYREISKIFKDTKYQVVSRSQMEGALDYQNKPMPFILKWCDFIDKYGLGYQLSDSSIGGVFNDGTLMVHRKSQYMCDENLCVDRNGRKSFCHNCYVYGFEKKYKIIKLFKTSFNRNQVSESNKVEGKYKIALKNLPYVTNYKESNIAIGFLFSDKSLQVNFFEDHIKVIVSPLIGTISIIGRDKQLKTYNLKKLSSTGWDLLMAEKMYYIKSLIDEWSSLKRKIGGDANNIPVKIRFNNRG